MIISSRTCFFAESSSRTELWFLCRIGLFKAFLGIQLMWFSNFTSETSKELERKK